MTDASRRTVLKRGTALGIAALAGCTAPTVETRAEETRRISRSGRDSLELRNANGSISVEPWDGDDVELRIVKRGFFTDDLDAAEVTVGGDETLTIERVVGDDESSRVVVSFEVRVPADFPVTDATTSNGSVDVRGTVGDVDVRTTNGSISVRRVDGFVSLTTTNGSVTCSDVGGVDGARTTNGSIDVEVPAIRGDASIESSNGSIDAALAGDLNADLLAQTSTGSVDASGLSLGDASVSRTRVAGTLGDGGPTLTILTSNGGIELSLL